MSKPLPITHLLYLHGFRSSPQSTKARTLARHLALHHPAVHWWCPQLPASPRAAMTLLRQGTSDWTHKSMAVVGSSLGGFYATALAQKMLCRAVLLNPAINPARDLKKYIGEQTSWHDPQQRFFFGPEFVQELQELQALARPGLRRPERSLLVIAKGDELLDWREMRDRYAGAHIRLLEGGDHALSDFDAQLPAVLAFLGLN